MDRLSRFALEHGLLTDVCRVFRSDAKNPVLIVLQLILVHVNLGLDVRRQPLCQTLGFDCSQKIVYETVLKQPIFMNSYTTVNVDFLLHCVNFFKYHLTRKETMTAYEAYRDLPTDYLPQGLQGNLHNDGYELGKKWMGTFGMLTCLYYERL